MSERLLAGYRSPTVMVIAVLGLLVLFGGLWVHSEGLILLGALMVVLGGRLVDFVSREERAGLRDWWGRFLDDFSDSTCLLSNLAALILLSLGFWGQREGVIIIGLVVAAAGHYYARRGRQESSDSDSSRGGPLDAREGGV
jgi:uncharacterized membrane protein